MAATMTTAAPTLKQVTPPKIGQMPTRTPMPTRAADNVGGLGRLFKGK